MQIPICGVNDHMSQIKESFLASVEDHLQNGGRMRRNDLICKSGDGRETYVCAARHVSLTVSGLYSRSRGKCQVLPTHPHSVTLLLPHLVLKTGRTATQIANPCVGGARSTG